MFLVDLTSTIIRGCKPTGKVTPVLSEQCQPTMTTYDKYHSHEWECSDDETYVKPRVLSPESQAKLDSQFVIFD